jgi:uncharacterized protein (TIGR03437 family)
MRIKTSLCVLVLQVACWGQPAGAKKHAFPDFDVRDRAVAQMSASQKATVDLRRANIDSFLATERVTRPGVRVVPSQFGLPKVFLRDGGTLSAPSALDPEETARNFLRTHSSIYPFTSTELDNLRLVVKDTAGDAAYLSFNQTLGGIDVFNAQIKVTLTKAGEVVQVTAADVIPGLAVSIQPRLSDEQSAGAAMRAAGNQAPAALSHIPDQNGKTAFRNPHGANYSPITSELVIFPMDATSARLAYRTFVDTDPQTWYEILIDAQSGALLLRHNLYTHAGQANVWTQSPLAGSRQLVTFPDGWLPAAPNGASATGWVSTGNNADAYLDADGNDKPDPINVGGLQGGRAYDPNAVFNFPFGDGTVSQDPRFFQSASVINLFYFLNTAHDYYYGLGFNEAAGNFQTDNFGKGGKGNDAVLGESQQGTSSDNASFAPTPDGTAPKIRVGIDTRGTDTKIDDLDYDYSLQVVMHEYGHGVSNRLVGSTTSTTCLQNIQSGAMGEGWSDYFAISFSNNPVFGAYGGNATAGIRRQSYEGYTFTYADLGNGTYGYEVHDDGEVWAATLWDLRKSLGQTVTDRLVINGLKSTPCNPSMTDARDAILAADQAATGGVNRAQLWQVFARHGLGYSAYGSDGTVLRGTEYDASYDQPPDLQTLKNPAITSKPLAVQGSLGGAYSYTVTATNPNAGTLSFALTSGPAGMAVDPASGKVTWTGGFTGQRVEVTVMDGKGGKVVQGYALPVLTLLTLGNPITIGGAEYSAGFASVTVPANVTVLQVTTRGGTGDADLTVTDPTGDVQYSMRTGNNETLSYALPTPGVWQVEVDGYATYSGVSLSASLVTPAPLSPNTTLTNLSGIESSETLYKVTIPVGATSFTVSTSGGTGDVDLFLRKGQPAVCQASLDVSQQCYFDQFSAQDGNAESITAAGPGAGDWYVDLSAFLDYSGVTLTTNLTVTPTLAVSAASLTFAAVQGGTAPASQSLAISNGASAVFNWAAQATTSTGGSWLSIDKTAGGGNDTIKVTADPTGMKAGTYQGTVTITASALAGSPQRIAVTLTITNASALAVGASTLTFQGAPGVNPPAQTVTINNTGGGVISWTATATSAGNWLQVTPASGSGNGSVQVSAVAGSMPVGSYTGTVTITASGAANSPATIQVTFQIIQIPVLTTVVQGASFQPGIVPGSWVTITGANFTTITDTWDKFVVNGNLPPSLDGVSVSIGGKAAYIYFISPNQINAQAPNVAPGTVPVTVTNGNGTSAVTTATIVAANPAFFLWSSKYAVATRQDYSLAAAPGTIPGLQTVAAKPGDVLILWATGLGATTPAVPAGIQTPGDQLYSTAPVTVTIGAAQAQVYGSALAPGLAGLYQVAIQVPAGMANGDYAIKMAIAGVSSPNSVFLSVQH